MNRQENNDWNILNSIIYSIYTTENFDEMRRNFLSQLKLILDFDSAAFFVSEDKNSEVLSNPVYYNCDQDITEMLEKIESHRKLISTGKMLIYRETDIITEDNLSKTEYYNRFYRENNWHYSMQMNIASDKNNLGVVVLYRTIGKENFQADDIFILDILKNHMAYRLLQHLKKSEREMDKLSISEASDKFDLTKRENTVLKMLIEGRDSDSVCGELSISPNTLKKHILNIYRKLGIRNRVQLFKMVRESE